MTLLDQLENAQSRLLKVNVEVSTGTWSGPDVIDPDVLDDCYQVEISAGFDQINASCTVRCASDPGLAVNAPIQVFAGYNGEGAAIFKGEVSGKTIDFAPSVRVTPCRDRLGRTRFGWPEGERVYTEQDDAALIRNILEGYGLPSTIAEIESSGWTLGTIQDVTLKAGQAGWNLISEIDNLTTYRTYTDLLGVIRRRNIFANVTTPVYAFEEGVNIIRIQRTSNPIWPNKAVVNGLTYEEVPVTVEITTTNEAIPNPPGVLAIEVQSDHIETEADARRVAVAVLSMARAEAEQTEIETFGNPLIQPGDLIHVNSAEAGGAYDTIVQSVRHTVTASSFLTTIHCIGILNGDGATSGFDPVAIAAVTAIDMESVIISGSPEVRYFVQLDGVDSYDADGRIVTWAWAVTGGSAAPSSGSGPRFATVLEDLSGVSVTLTVTDEQGLTDDVTIPISEASQPVKTRALAIAGGSDGLVFIRDASGTPLVLAHGGDDCISVPAIFTGNAWAGWDSGILTRVNAGDMLDDVYDFSSPVRSLWVNEGDPANILAGTDTNVQRSLDEGLAWSILYATGTVYDVQSSPSLTSDVRYTTAYILWQSFDQTVLPTPVVAGPGGSLARMIASAPWDIAVCFSGAGSPGHTIRFEGSEKLVNWAGVSSPPTSITAITPNLVTPGFVAGDDAGRLFKLTQTAVGYDATSIATIGSGNAIRDLMRDGAMDGIIYVAASGGTGAGVYKLVNLTTAYQLWAGDAQQIGYGDLGEQSGVYEILWPTWGQATTGVWHLQEGAWSFRPFPRAGVFYIYGIAASRNGNEALVTVSTESIPTVYHTNEWWFHRVSAGNKIVMPNSTYSPLWHVDLTKPVSDPTAWTEILLPSPIPGPDPSSGSASTDKIIINVPEWSPDAGHERDWIITRGANKTSGVPAVSSWWRGTGATVGGVVTEPDRTTNDMQPATAGLDRDIIALDYYDDSPIFNLRYIPNGSITSIPAGGVVADGPSGKGRIEMIRPGVDRAVAIASDGAELWISTDYRSDEPVQILTGVGHRIAVAGGALYFGGRDSGVYKVTDPLGSPSGAIVAATGEAVDWIRSDRQTRTTVVAHIPDDNGLIGTLDGTTWDAISGPGGVTEDQLSDVFEVIRR